MTDTHKKFRTCVPRPSRIEEEERMETFIILADDDFSRCDDCGHQADVLTGSGDLLCADCVNIRAGMEDR